MLTDLPKGKGALPDCLHSELRTVNAHAPRQQKPLRELLADPHPHVACCDGSVHYFRRKELEYLSQMIYESELNSLLLPIIIEVLSDRGGMIVRSKTGIEAKILSRVLEMPVRVQDNMIRLYRPQLSVIRKALKTTSQYLFF